MGERLVNQGSAVTVKKRGEFGGFGGVHVEDVVGEEDKVTAFGVPEHEYDDGGEEN